MSERDGTYVVVGAGAIGGTVGARMIQQGHSVLFCDADAEHVDAINRDGLRIEGPVEQFVVEAQAVTPDGLPERLDAGPAGGEVAAHGGRARGDRAAARARRVRRLAAERRQRAGDRLDRRRGADGRRLRQLRRRLPRTGPHLPRRPRRAVRRRARRASQRARRATARRPAGCQGDTQYPRLPLGEGGIRRDAVRHRRLRPLDRRRALRAAVPHRLHAARPRGSRRGAGARRGVRRLRRRRPRRLDRAARRVQPAVGQDALGHLPRPDGAQAPDGEGDPRRHRRAAAAPHARADRRDRGGTAHLRGREPRAARGVRAAAGAGRAERRDHRAAAGRRGQERGRCTASPSPSRTTSTSRESSRRTPRPSACRPPPTATRRS